MNDGDDEEGASREVEVTQVRAVLQTPSFLRREFQPGLVSKAVHQRMQ